MSASRRYLTWEPSFYILPSSSNLLNLGLITLVNPNLLETTTIYSLHNEIL